MSARGAQVGELAPFGAVAERAGAARGQQQHAAEVIAAAGAEVAIGRAVDDARARIGIMRQAERQQVDIVERGFLQRQRLALVGLVGYEGGASAQGGAGGDRMQQAQAAVGTEAEDIDRLRRQHGDDIAIGRDRDRATEAAVVGRHRRRRRARETLQSGAAGINRPGAGAAAGASVKFMHQHAANISPRAGAIVQGLAVQREHDATALHRDRDAGAAASFDIAQRDISIRPGIGAGGFVVEIDPTRVLAEAIDEEGVA